ncbi:hypothetical protein MBLNU459_g6752t1 [Dothideomycetes sp. NU459]
MPPMRTMPAAKPVKTERTHEENQERAYIAASRRSDRSLEARVESARRASEIHKRRTGRSLRVTEQDVVNEEMYEEEDDDLPMQYRRLTAHLQTTNVDFDRRLAAYLTNHVAMRTALGQAVSDSYAHQQYPNAPQFANQMSQFPQGAFPNPMAPPQMANRSPQNYRQSPYPQTAQQGFRLNGHGRAASIATPMDFQTTGQYPGSHSPVNTFIKQEDRRMSLPAQPLASPPHMSSPGHTSPGNVSRTSSSANLANLKHEAAQQGYYNGLQAQSGSPHSKDSPKQRQRPQMNIPNFPAPFTIGGYDPTMTGMPFSTVLPNEAQQLLGPAFDSKDPFTAMLMGNQESRTQQPFYSYNPNPSSKPKDLSPPSNFEGMNQTLAPGMLDTPMNSGNSSTPSGTDSMLSPQDGYGNYNFTGNFMDPFKGPSSSGLTTPGEQDWTNLIDANAWEDTSSQPTFV